MDTERVSEHLTAAKAHRDFAAVTLIMLRRKRRPEYVALRKRAQRVIIEMDTVIQFYHRQLRLQTVLGQVIADGDADFQLMVREQMAIRVH